MRLSTVILCDMVLQQNGIRAAGRLVVAPPSTVTAALARLEKELSVALVRRGPAGMSLSVQAEQIRPQLHKLALLCRKVYRLDPEAPAEGALQNPVTFEALFRLQEVLRSGSIRKAAQILRMGQPQLTRTVTQIEARLARQFLLRTPQGTRPTPAGVALMDTIEDIRTSWNRLRAASDIRFERSLRERSLGSVIPSGAHSEIADMMARVSLQWHHRYSTSLLVASATAEELLAGLDEGRFDAVLLDGETVERRYHCTPFLAGRLALFGHELPDEATDPGLLEALSRRPMAMQSLRSGLRQRSTQFLEDVCGPDWRRRIPLMEIDSVPVTLNAVLYQGVNSILPASLILPKGVDVQRRILPTGYLQSLSLISRTDAQSLRFIDRLLELF